MNEGRKFAITLFGYKKEDVYNFLEKFSKDVEKRIKEKDEKIDELSVQNKKLNLEAEQLKERFHEIEEGRTHIANAIIKAEKQAKEMIESAIEDANSRKEQIEKDIDTQEDMLEQAKNDLHQLKMHAMKVVNKLGEEIVDLAGELEMDVEYEAAATEE